MNSAEKRYLELVRSEIESAIERYNPLKMQSSYVSLGFIRNTMVNEGTVRNVAQAQDIAHRLQSKANRIITTVGNSRDFYFDDSSNCMYPKD